LAVAFCDTSHLIEQFKLEVHKPFGWPLCSLSRAMAQRKMGLGDVNTAGIMLLRHPLVSMFKNLCFGLLSVLTVVALPTRARAQTTPPGYFQTTFQSESQFIVETVVSDLGEQIYFAAKGRLPESKDFSVAATERSDSPPDAPIYNLQINLDREHNRLKLEVPPLVLD